MKDIIKIITQVLLFCGVTFWAMSGYGDDPQYLVSGSWCVVLTLCCYWIRQKMNQILFFVSGHMLVFFIGIAVIQLGNYPWGFAALMVMILSCSLILCFVPEARGLEEPGYFQLILLGMVFLLGFSNGEKSQYVLNFSFTAFFVILLLKVLYGNQKAMDTFVRDRASSTRMDVKKMKKLNHILSFSYTGILCLVLLVANTFQTDEITRRIGAWIWNLIAMLLGKIENGEGGGGEASDYALELSLGESSAFWKFLEALFKVIAISALLALVIGGVYCLVMAICRRFYNCTDKMEDAQDYAEPLTASKKLQRKKRKSFFEKIERTPARQVRRIYKKRIHTSMPRINKKMHLLSPKEQIAEIKLPDENAEELLAIYEKARYSKSEITRTDVQRMKELTNSSFF